MTIKPVVNQKSAKEETQEGTSQAHGSGGVRTAHRNVVLNQLSSSESQVMMDSENQALPRDIRVHTPHSFDNDSVVRHRRSPHKNLGRLKRDHYHKRESRERDKATGSPSYHHHGLPSVSGKKQSASSCSSPLAGTAVGGRSPKSTLATGSVGGSLSGLPGVSNSAAGAGTVSLSSVIEEALSGYNSGDEHIGPKDAQLTPDEWKKRDETFAKDLSERGFILHDMEEDGACLFRAISLQIYGDQGMHEEIRLQTMNYIYQNREYFAQFVTEDIADYVKRKRANHVHGNHIEIQAMSEMYNRSVELYCYQIEPINIFNSDQINNGNEPLRLSYQRGSHYNAIVNPYKASVGVGLGLAGYRPDELDIKQVDDAVRMSEELEIEKTMFEDKLKTTDWEATNEAIEEQIARESYLQWCRDNMRNSNTGGGGAGGVGGSGQNKSTSTITSTEMMAAGASGSSFSGHGLSQQQTSSFVLEMRASSTGQQSTLAAYDGTTMLNSSAGSSSSKNSSFELDCSPPSPAQCSSQTGASSFSVQQQYYYKTAGTNSSTITTKAATTTTGTTTSTSTSSNINTSSPTSNTVASNTASVECNRRKKRILNAPTDVMSNYSETKKPKSNSNRTASAPGSPPRPRSVSPLEGDAPVTSLSTAGSSTVVPAKDSSENVASSGTNTQQQLPGDETPVSEFYQSLLESSYTDDGSFGQLSEREMIQKALEESAMDFVKRSDGSKATLEDKYGTTDEEYDSPSP